MKLTYRLEKNLLLTPCIGRERNGRAFKHEAHILMKYNFHFYLKKIL